jgi:predicted alpha/beta-hydrolase family hydrolase
MELTAPTSLGAGRLTVDQASAASAVLWLGHGAGGGIEARDLVALAAALPRHGITVVRHEQPWRVAGKKLAPRPAALDAAWLETAPLVADLAGGLPLLVGGRSAGARVACRTADAVAAVGVVCLAFPLHPPGKPEKSRLEELLLPAAPVLVVQGERDTFGSAASVASATAGRAGIRVVMVPGADHGLAVLKSSPLGPESTAALLAGIVLGFVGEVIR